jgi:hypothetical protein
MRFRLRTLLIVVTLGPPMLATCYLLLAPNAKRHHGQEGHWIYGARIIGNSLHTDKKLLKVLGLPMSPSGIRGWRLNTDSAEDARNKIEQFYHQAGHPYAVVSLRSGGKRGDKELILEIQEGNRVARLPEAP